MYDLLLVGSGISAAAICACLKHRMRVCVVDVRSHVGGNCYDRISEGSYIHQYGPHIFHSKSPDVVAFLSKFTSWVPTEYRVLAEIENDNVTIEVPFPYSRQTAQVIGRSLTDDEIIDRFFRGYSIKMWGMDWDELPKGIKGRVPKDTAEGPSYFPNEFVALPKLGYTHMIENMLDGADVRLSLGPRDWEGIPAKQVIFFGRPDLIVVPGETATFGEMCDLRLDHRSLDITFSTEPWDRNVASMNFCSMRRPFTRKTSYAQLTGGHSPLVSCETPKQAAVDDITPYYPIPSDNNLARHKALLRLVRQRFPNLIFCGRLATYKYLDMYQAVGQALAIVKSNFMFSHQQLDGLCKLIH